MLPEGFLFIMIGAGCIFYAIIRIVLCIKIYFESHEQDSLKVPTTCIHKVKIEALQLHHRHLFFQFFNFISMFQAWLGLLDGGC